MNSNKFAANFQLVFNPLEMKNERKTNQRKTEQ